MRILLLIFIFTLIHPLSASPLEFRGIYGDKDFYQQTVKALKTLESQQGESLQTFKLIKARLNSGQLYIYQSIDSDSNYITVGCGRVRTLGSKIPVIYLNFSKVCFKDYLIIGTITHEFDHILTTENIIGEHAPLDYTALTDPDLPYRLKKFVSAMEGNVSIDQLNENRNFMFSEKQIEDAINFIEFISYYETRGYIKGYKTENTSFEFTDEFDAHIVGLLHTHYLGKIIPKYIAKPLYELAKTGLSYEQYVKQLDQNKAYKQQLRTLIQQQQVSTVIH